MNKEEFISKVLNNIENMDGEEKYIENELKALEEKIAELDRKFEQLYDDRLNGILSDRKFQDLSTKCESEQDIARARRAELIKIQDNSQTSLYAVERFVELAESMETLIELDNEILNRLINSIVVGDRIKKDGRIEQHISINYNFIGKFVC